MRFCFYSGYRDLKGGYTTLLLTLIKELHNQNQNVILINFKNGLLVTELNKENIQIDLLDIDSMNYKEMSSHILPTDIFIITSFREAYRHFLKVNPKVIYYDINDFITSISAYKFGFSFSSHAKRLLKSLIEKRALVFMDDTGIFNLKNEFSLTVSDPVFLPIPVKQPTKNIYLEKEINQKDFLHITYVGRSVNWKMMPLKHILQGCSLSTEKKIRISIVVDSISKMNEFINIDNYRSYSHLEILIFENLAPSQLDDFLLKNADIHFAMGTAALDAARIGIPTILVDYSVKKFPQDYRYKWLFQTKGFSLGRNLDKLDAEEGLTLDEIFRMFSVKNNIEEISRNCYNYVLTNHSVSNLIPQLIRISKESNFRLKDSRKYIPFYWRTHALIKNISSPFIKNEEEI